MEDEIMTARADEDFDGGWESEAFSEVDFSEAEAGEELPGASPRPTEETGNVSEETLGAAPAPAESAAPPADYMRPDFIAFVREHPEVSVQEIPRDVWERVSAGESLPAAWMRYENETMRAELLTLRQNEKNSRRSAGSRASAGKTQGVDPFDMGWDDDR